MEERQKAARWWWGGTDEALARRRFAERFGREATVVEHPQPGVIALGPVESEETVEQGQMQIQLW